MKLNIWSNFYIRIKRWKNNFFFLENGSFFFYRIEYKVKYFVCNKLEIGIWDKKIMFVKSYFLMWYFFWGKLGIWIKLIIIVGFIRIFM